MKQFEDFSLSKLSPYLDFFQTKVQYFITLIALNLIYFLGIGITAILAKQVNKSFYKKGSNTTWEKTSPTQTNLSKMY